MKIELGNNRYIYFRKPWAIVQRSEPIPVCECENPKSPYKNIKYNVECENCGGYIQFPPGEKPVVTHTI